MVDLLLYWNRRRVFCWSTASLHLLLPPLKVLLRVRLPLSFPLRLVHPFRVLLNLASPVPFPIRPTWASSISLPPVSSPRIVYLVVYIITFRAVIISVPGRLISASQVAIPASCDLCIAITFAFPTVVLWTSRVLCPPVATDIPISRLFTITIPSERTIDVVGSKALSLPHIRPRLAILPSTPPIV